MTTHHRPVSIGQILIEQGVLSEQQLFEIVEAQKSQRQPFGVLAERLFDVSPASIERAWAEQHHRFTDAIDLHVERIDAAALALLIGRR